MGASSRHGLSGTPTYYSWVAMKERCSNPRNVSFKDYGGRGIAVCDQWHSFTGFLADMGLRPDGATLDRYPDGNGNYEPGNCRWATPLQQGATRRNRREASLGLTVADLRRQTGVSEPTLRSRVAAGVTGDALTAPPLSPDEQRRMAIRARVAANTARVRGRHEAAMAGGSPCPFWCKLCSPDQRRASKRAYWAARNAEKGQLS